MKNLQNLNISYVFLFTIYDRLIILTFFEGIVNDFMQLSPINKKMA